MYIYTVHIMIPLFQLLIPGVTFNFYKSIGPILVEYMRLCTCTLVHGHSHSFVFWWLPLGLHLVLCERFHRLYRATTSLTARQPMWRRSGSGEEIFFLGIGFLGTSDNSADWCDQMQIWRSVRKALYLGLACASNVPVHVFSEEIMAGFAHYLHQYPSSVQVPGW